MQASVTRASERINLRQRRRSAVRGEQFGIDVGLNTETFGVVGIGLLVTILLILLARGR